MQPILTECTTSWPSWFTVEGNRAVGHGGRMLGGGQVHAQDAREPLRYAGPLEVSVALGAVGRK